ncbi:MAG: glycosyltransferase [Eubacterium sp.]|nr:glycosyltransferase [Eubacterium sp.]
MKLMIQIPCYNEAETLRTALDALPKQIEGIDTIEYLIIDDGSEDETAETARAWGVDYVVHFRSNRGLAKGFMAGLDACLRNGADIIVNTDADNQYEGADIEKLVRPIIEGRSDIVIGARPIDEIEDFSPLKKKLQHFGSFIVRKASRTTIPDAPSGFRAYSRDAAMRLNVTNEYTYTLETIVQAGRTKMAMDWVPVRTNKEIRPSRLMKSMMGYIKKSVLTIGHVFMMYKPLHFFVTIGIIIFLCGTAVGMRFLVCYFHGVGSGHVQSLILAAVLLLLGFQTIIVGLLADVIASNRKILEDVQYHVRRMDYDGVRLSKEKQESKEEEPKKENIEKAKPKKENIEKAKPKKENIEKAKPKKENIEKDQQQKKRNCKKAKNKKSEIAKKQKSKKAEAEKQKSPK